MHPLKHLKGWPGPYIYTVYACILVIFLPKTPYIHRICMVLANPIYIGLWPNLRACTHAQDWPGSKTCLTPRAEHKHSVPTEALHAPTATFIPSFSGFRTALVRGLLHLMHIYTPNATFKPSCSGLRTALVRGLLHLMHIYTPNATFIPSFSGFRTALVRGLLHLMHIYTPNATFIPSLSGLRTSFPIKKMSNLSSTAASCPILIRFEDLLPDIKSQTSHLQLRPFQYFSGLWTLFLKKMSSSLSTTASCPHPVPVPSMRL